jgi:hypothetical protein
VCSKCAVFLLLRFPWLSWRSLVFMCLLRRRFLWTTCGRLSSARERERLVLRLLSLGANRVSPKKCKNNASGEDAHPRSHAACAAVEGAHHRQNQIESCYSHLWLHWIWYTSVGTFSFFSCLFLSLSFSLLVSFSTSLWFVLWVSEMEKGARNSSLSSCVSNLDFSYRDLSLLKRDCSVSVRFWLCTLNTLSQDFPSLDLSVCCGVYEEVLEVVLVSSVWTPAATA